MRRPNYITRSDWTDGEVGGVFFTRCYSMMAGRSLQQDSVHVNSRPNEKPRALCSSLRLCSERLLLFIFGVPAFFLLSLYYLRHPLFFKKEKKLTYLLLKNEKKGNLSKGTKQTNETVAALWVGP